jgi:hypothetical protein
MLKSKASHWDWKRKREQDERAKGGVVAGDFIFDDDGKPCAKVLKVNSRGEILRTGDVNDISVEEMEEAIYDQHDTTLDFEYREEALDIFNDSSFTERQRKKKFMEKFSELGEVYWELLKGLSELKELVKKE